MLCGEAPRTIIEQLQQRISSYLELADVNPVNRHLIDPARAGRWGSHPTSSIQLRTLPGLSPAWMVAVARSAAAAHCAARDRR
jgi:hypothetical protein